MNARAPVGTGCGSAGIQVFNFSTTALNRYIFRLVIVPMMGVFALAASLLMLRQDAAPVRFRRRSKAGQWPVVFKMLGALIPEYGQPCDPFGPASGRAAGLPQARHVERTRHDARGRACPTTVCCVSLMPSRWCSWRSMSRWCSISSPSAAIIMNRWNMNCVSGALGASIKKMVGEFTTLARYAWPCGSRE